MRSAIKNLIESTYQQVDYPTLVRQAEKWSVERPLAGLRVLDSTPVFRNTLAKYIPLLEAGASLSVGISHIMPRDEKVLEFLRGIGVDIVTPDKEPEQPFDIILDCAAAFSALRPTVGYVELTRSGVERYRLSERPVYVADSSRIKRIETSLGTGDSYFRAMAHLGYEEWEGRKLVIFGAGKVGSGIALYGRKVGTEVLVFDENSPEEEVVQAIAAAYAVVSATGVVGALDCFAEQLALGGALIANMGVGDEFGDKLPASRVLSDKRPLNFILEEPTHLRYIETTMALHNHGAIELLANRHRRGLIEPSPEIEAVMLDTVASAGVITNELKVIL